MPIKSLESYLFERKLVFQSSIDILTNSTIGIDVEHYLSKIYTQKKEHYLSAIGGVPSSLKEYLQSDLEVFKQYNIKPIFVISGLKIESQLTNYRPDELSPYEQSVEHTWNKISSFQKQNAHQHQHQHHFPGMESFRSLTETIPLEPMINDLVINFIELGIDYLITPYDASFQLSYLYQKRIIDTVYASTDIMLTRIDKFILGMEFQSKEFRFVDKRKVLQELALNERQFMDLSLMVGCGLQPHTFPIFQPQHRPTPQQQFPPVSYFKQGLDMVYQYIQFSGNNNDLYGYILNFNEPKFIDWYIAGHVALKYVPIMTQEGYTELYNVEIAKLKLNKNVDYLTDEEDETETKSASGKMAEDKRIVKVPSGLHEVISQRLPPELYLYQSVGLLPLGLLSSIARGSHNVRPPLEMGYSVTYQKLVASKFYTDLLDYQYNLITQLLARYYQVKKIKVKFWFKNSVEELNNRITPSVGKRVEKLYTVLDGGLDDKFDLQTFFTNGLNSESTTTIKEIKSPRDVLSTAVLRALVLYGIIDEKQSQSSLSSIGKILQSFCSKNKLKQKDLEHLVAILLLLKSNSLKLDSSEKEFTGTPKSYKNIHLAGSGAPYSLTEIESKSILLISRIFSLKGFSASPINYQGPISRNLLSFRSHIEFVTSNLLHTIECLLIDLIVRQENNHIKAGYQSKDDWYKLVSQIPFYQSISNTLMGIVAEIYFEVALKHQKTPGTNIQDSILFAKDYLANHIFLVHSPNHNINIQGSNAVTKAQLETDLQDGVQWWKTFVNFMKIVNEYDNGLCSAQLLNNITDADALLSQFV